MSLSLVLGENSKKVKIDEKEYELSPLTLWDIAQAEERFECDLESFHLALKKIKNLLFFLYLSLNKKNPSLTPQSVGELFKFSDVKQLGELLTAVMELSGMTADSKNE